MGEAFHTFFYQMLPMMQVIETHIPWYCLWGLHSTISVLYENHATCVVIIVYIIMSQKTFSGIIAELLITIA